MRGLTSVYYHSLKFTRIYNHFIFLKLTIPISLSLSSIFNDVLMSLLSLYIVLPLAKFASLALAMRINKSFINIFRMELNIVA